MYRYGLGVIVASLLGASSIQAATFTDCSLKTSFQEFVECSRFEAPEFRIAIGTNDAANLKAKAARRWLNPELDAQAVFGKTLGNEQYQYQFSLLQTLEFGGRSARIQEAEANKESAEAQFQNADAEVRAQIYSKILRLSQVEKEKAALDEAIQTFKKLVSQYASRPRLSPEQEVSNTVFKIAQGDFLMRRVQLVNHEREVTNELKLHLRSDEDTFRKWVIDPAITLPDYKSKDFEVEKTPEYRIGNAQLTTAKAQKSLENAEAFSDIKIGPMVQLQYDGAQRAQLYGAQITMPFPMWNQNGYGREGADRKVEAAEVGLELEKKKTLLERARLVATYQDYVSNLKLVPTQKDLEAKHEKVEAQYLRGLVNSALIVEAHRSLIDFQKLRHESEIKALETLWSLYRMDGRTEEIHL